MRLVVDVHHHAIPAALIHAVRTEGARYGAAVKQLPDGREVLALADGSRSPIHPPLRDEALRAAELAEAQIDVGFESILPTALFYCADERQAGWFSRVVNDAIVENVRTSKVRLYGMAYVPLQFPQLAVRELERAVSELHMSSVQIGSNVRERNLDEPELIPFWDAAQALDVLIFVHPHDQAAANRLQRYWLRNLIGNPLDTSIAIASVIFGGVLERYPRLKLVFAHAGGYAPWIRGRWRHGQQVRAETKERGATRPFDDYFARLYFDTVIHDERALTYLVDTVGADHVLHGTDYPADMGSISQVPVIRNLSGLNDQDKDAILGGNALRLIGAR
jgi:aminocarboxymuconate-semialdehyde decarboxylase